jgi:hypothetical protein
MKALEFKKEAERAIDRIKSTVWTSTCLDLCIDYTNILIINKNLNPTIQSALIKSTIIEYNKIFNSETRAGLSNKYLTKNSSFSQKQHRILDSLRNLGVAHSDPNFEGQIGYFFFGNKTNSDYKESPIKSVEVPIILHVQSQNFAALDNDVIKIINEHLKECSKICSEYISSEAKSFFELCIKNYRSLSSINNAFLIELDDKETHPPSPIENLINQRSFTDLPSNKFGWISKTFIHSFRNQLNLMHEDEFIKIENIENIDGYRILFKNKGVNDSTAPKPSPAA